MSIPEEITIDFLKMVAGDNYKEIFKTSENVLSIEGINLDTLYKFCRVWCINNGQNVQAEYHNGFIQIRLSGSGFYGYDYEAKGHEELDKWIDIVRYTKTVT